MRRLLAIVLAGLVAFVGGCGQVSEQDLDGKAFVSASLTGTGQPSGAKVRLEFEGTRLSATAGCNTLAGQYSLDGGTLVASDLASTQMACEPRLEAAEAWLKAFLAEGARAALDGTTLTLTGGATTIVLHETKADAGPAPIAGTHWTLVELHPSGGQPAAVSVEPPPTLEIAPDGTAAIYTGCNRGSAKAEVRDDGFVVFSNVATTRMACSGERGEVERMVLKVLDGAVAAGRSGPENDLSLAKHGDALIYRAK